jgi:hypothetical protein
MATVAVVCRKKDIPMVVELVDVETLRYTHALPQVDFVVGRTFCERMTSQAVLNPGVTEVYDRLTTFTEDSNEIYTVRVPEALVGKTFVEAQLHFMEDDGNDITPIGIDRSPAACPNSEFLLCPSAPDAGLGVDQQVLGEGDRLIVLAYNRPVFALRGDPWNATNLVRD